MNKSTLNSRVGIAHHLKVKDDMFFTITMAEILETQGHLEDALTIYKILIEDSPADMRLREKIDRINALAGKRVSR